MQSKCFTTIDLEVTMLSPQVKRVRVFSTANSFTLEQEGDRNVNFEGGEDEMGRQDEQRMYLPSVYYFCSYPPKTKCTLSSPLYLHYLDQVFLLVEIFFSHNCRFTFAGCLFQKHVPGDLWPLVVIQSCPLLFGWVSDWAQPNSAATHSGP